MLSSKFTLTGCCTAVTQRLHVVCQEPLGNVVVTSLRGQRSNQERPFKGAMQCAAPSQMAPLKIPSDIPLSASAACGRRFALG